MPRTDKLKIPGLNNIIIDGRLTKDPEVRYAQDGKAITNFALAHNERKKNKAGEWEDDAMYWDVTVFGKQAETLASTASKGDAIVVQGRLSMDRWTDDKGEHSRVKIIAHRAQLLTWPEQPETIPQQARAATVAKGEQSDDIPY